MFSMFKSLLPKWPLTHIPHSHVADAICGLRVSTPIAQRHNDKRSSHVSQRSADGGESFWGSIKRPTQAEDGDRQGEELSV